ncbi:DUF1697 domain-containing protein [Duganella sp. LX20W]|uniref:DUF1697 domain-containing protein n=1 Tax=Rugamonas brunnea TaxID=2758569 RepID=A0A7W2EST9_9BURK|nr:DUF1697 domain-containing protein [Rugamonas brunnea]MBA5637982.1 DUF1697 domain-containing protein [Rugamonas brunnea]
MTRYACMLRGINVSGQRKIAMKELVGVCQSLACTDVESYLQSGNIVLSSEMEAAELETILERAICSEFGYPDVDVLVRTAPELLAAINAVPPAWKGADTASLYFTFLKAASHAKVEGDNFLPDAYAIGEKVVYVHCPGGYGKTKLNNSYFERVLKLRATTRNWNTTTKLVELARG